MEWTLLPPSSEPAAWAPIEEATIGDWVPQTELAVGWQTIPNLENSVGAFQRNAFQISCFQTGRGLWFGIEPVAVIWADV